jgi:hypothetical protein
MFHQESNYKWSIIQPSIDASAGEYQSPPPARENCHSVLTQKIPTVAKAAKSL